jgi:hypothetical protein
VYNRHTKSRNILSIVDMTAILGTDTEIFKLLKKIGEKPVLPTDKIVILYQGFFSATKDADAGNMKEFKIEFSVNQVAKKDNSLSEEQIQCLTAMLASNATLFTNIYGYPRVLFVPVGVKVEMKFANDYDKIIFIGSNYAYVYNRVYTIGDKHISFTVHMYRTKDTAPAFNRGDLANVIGVYAPPSGKGFFDTLKKTLGKGEEAPSPPAKIPDLNIKDPITTQVGTIDEVVFAVIQHSINRTTSGMNTTLKTAFTDGIATKDFLYSVFKLGMIPFVLPVVTNGIVASHPLITTSRVATLSKILEDSKSLKSKISNNALKEQAISTIRNDLSDDEFASQIENLINAENFSDSDQSDIENAMGLESDYISSAMEHGMSADESD